MRWKPLENAFCPTGPGGGVDPSCSPSQSTSKSALWVTPSSKQLDRAHAVFDKLENSEASTYLDRQMRGGKLDDETGEFTPFTARTKLTNLNKTEIELAAIKASDPEAFEAVRQWKIAEEFGKKSYDEVPDTVVLYRGHTEGELLPKAVNVTHMKSVAETFGSKISQYEIAKSDIDWSMQEASAFGEGEILIFDTKKLKNAVTNIGFDPVEDLWTELKQDK